MGLMIDCKTATNMVSLKEEKRLSLVERFKLRLHFYLCKVCLFFYNQNKLIIKTAPLMEENQTATLTETEKSKMVEVLENDAVD